MANVDISLWYGQAPQGAFGEAAVRDALRTLGGESLRSGFALR